MTEIIVKGTLLVFGAIQQLRGQEEGEGVSKKSTLVHPGGGESLECPRGPKPSFSESISYHCAL